LLRVLLAFLRLLILQALLLRLLLWLLPWGLLAFKADKITWLAGRCSSWAGSSVSGRCCWAMLRPQAVLSVLHTLSSQPALLDCHLGPGVPRPVKGSTALYLLCHAPQLWFVVCFGYLWLLQA
jgi:hypothetical protein